MTRPTAMAMGRKRRGKPIHGWIIIDKPAGMTSSRVVGRVRAITGAAKAGHGGTLDPLATGVLPIALGEATKTVSWVMDGAKRYRFTVRWGEARATDDTEGEVTAVSDARADEAAIGAVLGRFTGKIEQTPPAYSAIKIDGRRAYDVARAGGKVELAPRAVVIESLRLVDMPDADHAVFEAVCGKGTYMRSLARDIALALGTVGHVSALRRSATGPFDEQAAISLESLGTLVHSAPPSDYLLAVETALDDIPALTLNPAQADHLRHGRPVRVRGPEGHTFVDIGDAGDGDMVCAMSGGQPVALARYQDDEIRPVRVLNI